MLPTEEYIGITRFLKEITQTITKGLEAKFECSKPAVLATNAPVLQLPNILAFYNDGLKIGEIDFSTQTFVLSTHARHFEPYALKIAAAFDKAKKQYQFHNNPHIPF